MSRSSNIHNNRKSLIYTPRSTLAGSTTLTDEGLDSTKQQTLELERLEQEITLTLQDIDRNLGKTNKIINDSLIPIIQSYAKSSKKLWDGSKFWKNFFEDSANVQFSGIEESMKYSEDYHQQQQQQKQNDDDDMELDRNVGNDSSNNNNNADSTTTGGQSIIDRYYNQVNDDEQEQEQSTLIRSTPKKGKSSQFESSDLQPPSSPPPIGGSTSGGASGGDLNMTTSSIFQNINKEEEINFHKAYKIRLTPNKRQKKGIFDDSPEIAPPSLTSFSPLKKRQQQQQQQGENISTIDSIQMANSPPRTMSFVKGQDQNKRTPSRLIAQSKTNDLKEIVGADDSSLQQPPQFTLTNINQRAGAGVASDDDSGSVQQKPPQLTNQYELDSILDNKFQEFNKTNDIDWSDEENP